MTDQVSPSPSPAAATDPLAQATGAPAHDTELGLVGTRPEIDVPPPGGWLHIIDDRPTRAHRRTQGKERRKRAPFDVLAHWEPPADRRDPIDLLEEQAKTRLKDLVAIRYGRMLASPFAYYRGTPIVMAADLASKPHSGITVQACGDAHILNFGVFATPERNQIFDVNDFDETIPGPWEWDVARLAASAVIAGRGNGFDDETCGEIARLIGAVYAAKAVEYSEMGNLDVWYSRVDTDAVMPLLDEVGRKKVDKAMRKAAQHNSVTALPKLTEVVDGRRRIIDDPPLITHPFDQLGDGGLLEVYEQYRATLPPYRRVLLDRYVPVDLARKVVGVGSVGTRCYVVLFLGEDGADPLFLQVKEAQRSVLEPYVEASEFFNQGERVVMGQRLMQAASDLFLGWTMGGEGNHFYVRQLRDMKGSLRIDRMDPKDLGATAGACAWTLARAHARSGDASMIAGYVGKGASFSKAIQEFALAYADQNQADYESFRQAANTGRIFATPGL